MNDAQMMNTMSQLYDLNHQELFECSKALAFSLAELALKANGYPEPNTNEIMECTISLLENTIPQAIDEAKNNYVPVKPKLKGV